MWITILIFLVFAIAALALLFLGIFRFRKGKQINDEEEVFRAKRIIIAGCVSFALAIIILVVGLMVLRSKAPSSLFPSGPSVIDTSSSALYPSFPRLEHCFNQIRDEDEFAIDCGGKDCGNCEGQACRRDSDCAAMFICKLGICAPLTDSETEKTSLLTPQISFIDPALGRVGDYITIFGKNFGSNGKVYFVKKEETKEAGFDFPEACRKRYWTDRAIIAKVPEFSLGSAQIKVVRVDDKESNLVPFRISAGASRPGLCLIEPSSGPVGIDLSLVGERFGETEGEARFFSVKGEENKTKIWSWNSSRIEAQVPQGAKTGPVQVLAQELLSNKYPFEISDCREQGCSGGLSCCPDGSCREKEACKNALPRDRYVWSFTTQGEGFFPEKLEILSHFPSNNQTNVCRNAAITFVFNQPIIRDAFESNFILEKLNGTNWEPLTNMVFEVFDREQGENKWTEVIISPTEPLSADSLFRATIKGGEEGVQSDKGLFLLSDFSFGFKTGGIICRISNVNLIINPQPFGRIDLFTCAGKDNCQGDQNRSISGNQHLYRAQAYSIAGEPLTASYFWSEAEDKEDVVNLDKNNTKEIFLTANQRDGQAIIKVEAKGPLLKGKADESWGEASKLQEIQVLLCENPWPSLKTFPFQDQAANFSFFYCRDRGKPGIEDDLPSLKIVPVSSPPDSRILKEFLFPLDVSGSKEAIGIKAMKNLEHYSPMRWYKNNVPVDRQGVPQTVQIDGYQALREETSTYVNAANIRHPLDFFTNIYILGYTGEKASDDLLNIWNQLAKNWRFNINVDSKDKALLIRDTKRLADLSDISGFLTEYKESSGRFPRLEAGTFIAGSSTSQWPSWQKSLGQELKTQLPLDPTNQFGACPGFDSSTCWNEKTKQFAGKLPDQLPKDSQVYVYKLLDREGFRFLLCAIMETGYHAIAKNVYACPQSSSKTIGRGGIGLNHSPVIITGPLPILVSAKEDFYVQAMDWDGDNLSWEVSGAAGWLAGPFATSVPSIRGFTASGSGNFTLAVRDEFGGEAKANVSVEVIK